MIIEKGTDILCIRYVDVGGYNCIDEHINLIDIHGFVWFGKIGNKPESRKLSKLLQSGEGYLLLKSPRKAYICKFNAFSDEIPPSDEYPEYYRTTIMPDRSFSIWFRICSISEITDQDILKDIILISSRSTIIEATHASMASHFYTVAKKDLHL